MPLRNDLGFRATDVEPTAIFSPQWGHPVPPTCSIYVSIAGGAGLYLRTGRCNCINSIYRYCQNGKLPNTEQKVVLPQS